MISLLIDTATERGLIALCQGEMVIKETHLPFGLHNSKVLFYELDVLFKATGMDKRSLNLVVCGKGPGSYTGMRVASASAQSLSFALEIPLVGVSTMVGFVSDSFGPFASIIDAKISGVYLQKAKKNLSGVQYLTPPTIVPIEQLLPEQLFGITTLVTPKKEILQQKIKGDFIWEEKGLSAEFMIKEALQRRENLDLLYLRKTQAELERKI